MDEERRPPRRRSPMAVAGELMAVAFEFIGTILAGVFIGWLADRWLSTEPWILIGSTLFGIGAGFYRMIVILRHFERADG
jgi:ATP synthase protein I